MPETLSLRRIFYRFFPRKAATAALGSEPKTWNHLSDQEKKDLALQTIAQGELALLQGNLTALSLFETSANLWPENPRIWYRQGLAFFEYGSEEGKEKALLLASKHFKIATQLEPTLFDAWVAWGNVLLQLGRFHEEHHFHLEAQSKYQKALRMSEGQPDSVLAELHWDYGIVWTELATHSGEALDLHLAICAFEQSLTLNPDVQAEFWHDYGNAYLELGLLINDTRYLVKAVEMLQRSVEKMENYFDGRIALAESYAQLYLNSQDGRYAEKAFDCYAKAVRLQPADADIWLSWAQLLAETGRLNKDHKALISSIEKCARAASLAPKDSAIMAQWVESLSYLGAQTNRLDLIVEAEQKILKATDLFPDDPDLWYAHGICCMSFAQYYEDAEYDHLAIEKLQYGLSLDRTNAEIWHALGLAHKHAADLTDDAIMIERAPRFLAKAMDLKPSCPPLIFDTAAAFLHYSEAIDDSSALDQAIILFESLLQNHRAALLHHPEWIFEYGCALEWLGEYSGEDKDLLKALEAFSHVLLIDPDFPKLHLRMALCTMQCGHLSTEPEYYRKAIQSFRLAARQDEENEALWLEWGLCLIHLAHHTIDNVFMDQLYLDAERKLLKAGQLGNCFAYYNLACLYSILGRTQESMSFIYQALSARALPSMEELLEDDWLDNLRSTDLFLQFITALEEKIQTREQ